MLYNEAPHTAEPNKCGELLIQFDLRCVASASTSLETAVNSKRDLHSLVALDELAIRQPLDVDYLGQIVLEYHARVRCRRRRGAGVQV